MEKEKENAGKPLEEKWHFGHNKAAAAAGSRSIRGTLSKVIASVEETGPRPLIQLGHGDPSPFPSFRTTPIAEDAIVEAVKSAQYNHYSPSSGLLPARRAVAEYLSKDIPYKLSSDDIFLTAGCAQAIDIVIAALARPDANILLPRPGFPLYEARCTLYNVEMRRFDLIPEHGWELDLDQVEKLTDENTVAIVLINPNNPSGSVLKYQHMEEIAKTARKLGIMVISDEAYGHLTFGSNPFIPMGVFGDVVPVLTLGSISKRWVVPGWRLGWIAMTDPKGILSETKVIDSIRSILDITITPVTFIQGAIPQFIEKTKDDFFNNIIHVLRGAAELCYNKIKDIKCITCPHKPEGSMFVMVKLNLSYLVDISDDVDFCIKLAKEDSVIICPGSVLEMKNWLRITFAIEPASLEVGLERLKSFCERHEKN
ncbi:Tyrosine aminotransferase [Rhynchospora pubera]|uniref:nicotianamine aminotransferase n=1 Tax=Rhynchospora pubera TaxID=906938 RepID=A0AAV8F6S0_9POAL|nr:Tyrosine aminotransferase [Rhynchospora pubera]KAJ4788729.1 Tyrosine aminotransferase [Rhynchospora pubera]